MKFGYFDDEQREYVIQRPDTPYPWINYLGFSDFFSLISNTAGGYSYFTDALFRRITRYRYNNVPLDNGGRYFYIKEGNTIWSPGWKPVKTKLDSYECRHGMGYTKIKGRKNELQAEVLFFVPMNYSGEVQYLCLKNLSSSIKKIKFFSFVEFCLWHALDDMSNFQRNFSTGEVEVDKGVIYHKTEYRERRNYYSFYSVNQQPQGFDTDRDSFIGLYNGFHEPEVVLKGTAKNSIAQGWAPVASHYFEFTLKPGEQKELIFILGFVENDPKQKWEKLGIINKDKALKMIKAYQTTQHVQKGFKQLKDHWEKLLANFQIQVDDEKLMRMVNIWNQYQCIVTYNISRSASYFESGIGRGIGFRDTNQDILGCVHQIPEIVRQRILDVAATQLKDGGAYHQYQPLTKQGNDAVGSNFNDDPLWLIYSVSAYIKETGDWQILDQVVDFENNSQLAAPMMEHLRRAFQHVVDNKGPHDLPLIGRADWNDCLNLNCFSTTPNESFQTCTNKDGKTAESIMIAAMFVLIGKEWVEICRRKGFAQEEEKAKREIKKIYDALLNFGWDGEWYLRAYDDAGEVVGSKKNKEGKIFIETQGICSMAEIGKDKGYPLKALDSVAKYLDTKHGIVLHNPAYTRYYLNLGEISTYPQGYKENAGIFCHNNPWIMIGEAIAGRANKAWQYYKKIAPAWREDMSEVHRLEPYVYTQTIAGKDGRRFGEAKNSWLTGTAAWNFVAISQWILGIRPEYDGLYIDPCLPDHIKDYTVWRTFRGDKYKIRIKNPSKISKGIKSAKLNGKDIVKTVEGGILINADKNKTEQEIEIIMG